MSMISPATVFTFNLGPITTLFIKPSINLNFIYSQGSSPPWNKDQGMLGKNIKVLISSLLTNTWRSIPLRQDAHFQVILNFDTHLALKSPSPWVSAMTSPSIVPSQIISPCWEANRILRIISTVGLRKCQNYDLFCSRKHWTWRLTCEPRGLLGQYFHSQWLNPQQSSGPLCPRQPFRHHQHWHCCSFLHTIPIKLSGP